MDLAHLPDAGVDPRRLDKAPRISFERVRMKWFISIPFRTLDFYVSLVSVLGLENHHWLVAAMLCRC